MVWKALATLVAVASIAILVLVGFDYDDSSVIKSSRITSDEVSRRVFVTAIACGDDHQRDLVANLLRSMLMFTDYHHEYTLILFLDNSLWQTSFEEILENFTEAEPKLQAKLVFQQVSRRAEDTITDQFKRCAGYRLTPGFYERLVELGYPRVIYTDTDVLIYDNIAKFWKYWNRMDGKVFGLVAENVFRNSRYYRGLQHGDYSGDDVFSPYGINSGVALWDSEMALKHQIGSVIQDIIDRNNGTIFLFDQDVLNSACQNPKYSVECELISCRWNYRYQDMIELCLSERQEGIGILHFNADQLDQGEYTLYAKIPALELDFPVNMWRTAFPCHNRTHCLDRMERELMRVISPFRENAACGSFDSLFDLPFEGSEFAFAASQVPRRTNNTKIDMYCRQLYRVRQTQEWLARNK